MPSMEFFDEKRREWEARPRPKSCGHEGRVVSVRASQPHQVGCVDCGYVVPAEDGQIDPIILP